jgi:hypothetical protein
MEKHTLIDYIEGNLSEDQRQEVEKYLQEHAEARQELEELIQTKSLLRELPFVEINAPTFVFDKSIHKAKPKTIQMNVQASRSYAWVRNLAAAVALLLGVAYFTQLRITYHNQQWIIGFGKINTVSNNSPKDNGLSQEQIHQIVRLAMSQKQDSLSTQINQLSQRIESVNRKSPTNQHSSAITEKELKQWLEKIKIEHLEAIVKVAEISAQKQQEYTDELLAKYAQYLEHQREEDLEVIGTHLKSIKENSRKHQNETDIILTKLIEKVAK